MRESTSKNQISLNNLRYYFDGVERERLDAGAVSRKSGEWLAVRTKLLKLPDATFEVVMRSINSLIDTVGPGEVTAQSTTAKGAERDRALALFEKVVQAEMSGHGSTRNVDRAAAV